MATLYAIIAAGLSSYLVTSYLTPYLGRVCILISLITWILVFYNVKKFLKDLKP